MLFLDVPTEAQLARIGPLQAIGIAGTARGMSPQQMQSCLPKIGRFFRDQQVPVLHYKCCSTFDSAAHTAAWGLQSISWATTCKRRLHCL